MGDRANILVKDSYDQNGVYLYTHWGGTDLPFTLQEALKKKWRWGDTSYLTRIIFCEMVKGEEEGETGFGISSKVGDGDDRILVVDDDKGTVSYNDKIWTFDEYIALDEEEISQVW
jgi:hypothetical protein